MELRTSSINFPKLRGNGPVTQTTDIHFPREVQKAIAGIIGYSSGFSGGNDHHLGKLQVQLDTEIDGDLVKVTGTFGLRDWSGDWDDDYEGNIQFVVVAELVGASEPRPRGDLSITGMEFNQATQHFRSSRHLDAPNIRPDNFIPLIARKDTAVRVYVDYDRNSGLPVINTLSGELVIDTGFNSVTITPENTVSPNRDNQIDRGQIDHTLNFIIPENFCQNQLVLRCKVFDISNPSPASRNFERTIYFENRVPLSLYAVGIHYTGQKLDLSAPTLSDITGTDAFSTMEVVYPVPEVYISGYTEIEFNKDMKADIDDGCGDGYSSLLDTLRDMQGSSSDVYYGFLPNGFDSGNVGGCGGGSGRVAASPFDFFGGLAQETGHAFGRDHAPCDDSSRCNNPDNQDDKYPQYADFDSDSIGEFGFNPRTNELFTPLNNHDFMGYSNSTPQWVSPYTYMGLLGTFPSSEGITAFLMRSFVFDKSNTDFDNMISFHSRHHNLGSEWLRKETLKLYLWITIDRKRNVTRQPSFCYYTAQVNNHGEKSKFIVELIDDNGNTLVCQNLIGNCGHCKENCYPKSFRQFIPYKENAKKLIIYEEDKLIYEEEIIIPEEHTLKFDFDNDKKGFILQWENLTSKIEHTYLLHWQDSDGQWRGLASRTQDKTAFIPAKMFGKRETMNIRLLCTTGISTLIVKDTLKLLKKSRNKVTIIPVGNKNLNNWFSVAVIENNKMIPDASIIWYNDNHQEVSRGKSINLKKLRRKMSVLHAVALYDGNRYIRTWILDQEGIHDVDGKKLKNK